jgi:hypothetical protein
LPISRFDPVLIEASLGFVVARPRFGSFGLGPAVGKPVGHGGLLGLAAFLPLPRGTEIDNITHQKLGGSRIVWIEAIQARMVCKSYAVTLLLDHPNRKATSCLYPERRAKRWQYPLPPAKQIFSSKEIHPVRLW